MPAVAQVMSPCRALAMSVVILSFSLAGCTGGSSGVGGIGSNDIEVPIWEEGDWWLYTFSTPDYSDDTARLVVASTSEEDGTAYMLAISSLTEARRHAVLNHNPFLGRKALYTLLLLWTVVETDNLALAKFG